MQRREKTKCDDCVQRFIFIWKLMAYEGGN